MPPAHWTRRKTRLRQRGLLKRHMHPNVSGGRIHRSDERNDEDENKSLRARERDAGCDHQRGTSEKKRAQIVTRSDDPDRQRQHRRAEERSRRNQPDLEWIETELKQIGGQDDGCKTVTEAPRRACRIEIEEVGATSPAQIS